MTKLVRYHYRFSVEAIRKASGLLRYASRKHECYEVYMCTSFLLQLLEC